MAVRIAPCALQVILALLVCCAELRAQGDASLKRLTLEELMDLDVTSVSRWRERVSSAASAVQVITGEDLRRSGVTSLPDALRLAAGVVVARQNAAGYAISTRGFVSTAANKLLVLIDGRSIYTPLFAGVFWEVQDVLIADIDRIEVIRGPGAAMWGSNAVNGVINVITRAAGDTPGTLGELGSGNEQIGYATVRYGGREGSAHYRVYGKYAYVDGQRRSSGADAHDPQRHGQGGFRVDGGLSPTQSYTLQGDVYSGRFGLNDRPDIEAWGGNVLGRWNWTSDATREWHVQAYYDRTHRLVPRQFEEDRSTVGVELQHRVRDLARHDLLVGAAYLSSGDDTDGATVLFDPARRRTSLSSAFAQDEIAVLPDRLWVMAGGRLEHNDYTGFEVQPTLRVRMAAARRQTIWAAVSRAVRTPTRFDRDLRFRVGDTVVVYGSDRFESENAVTTEGGYRVQPSERLALDASVFATRYTDLRSQERVGPGVFPVVLGNGLRGRTAGFEIIAEWTPAAYARVQSSYAFMSKSLRLEPGSTDLTGGLQEGNDPRHQGLVRWSLDLPHRVELDGTLRAVGELPSPHVPAYAEADLRLGWRVSSTVDLSLVGRDLLHARHPEFASALIRDEFERSVYALLRVRF